MKAGLSSWPDKGAVAVSGHIIGALVHELPAKAIMQQSNLDGGGGGAIDMHADARTLVGKDCQHDMCAIRQNDADQYILPPKRIQKNALMRRPIMLISRVGSNE